MVVQDNVLLAQRLAQDIRACGEIVVGPFSDMAEAMEAEGTVQAAILDSQDDGAFLMADRLMHRDIPFVFLTGPGEDPIPSRFGGRGTHGRTGHAASLLAELHRQHRRAVARQDDLRSVVVEMMEQSRAVMPDSPSADRLVETVLVKAVAQTVEGPTPPLFRPWLMGLMDDEMLRRRGRHLH